MRITEIRVEKKLSDGNYGSEGISITGAAEGLDPAVEIPKLKLIVEHALYGEAWKKRYDQALAVLNDAVVHDGTPETYNEAKLYVINYDAWIARVREAMAGTQEPPLRPVK